MGKSLHLACDWEAWYCPFARHRRRKRILVSSCAEFQKSDSGRIYFPSHKFLHLLVDRPRSLEHIFPPLIDDVNHMDELRESVHLQPNSETECQKAAFALLVSTLFFELNCIPTFRNGKCHCQGAIRCHLQGTEPTTLFLRSVLRGKRKISGFPQSMEWFITQKGLDSPFGWSSIDYRLDCNTCKKRKGAPAQDFSPRKRIKLSWGYR